MSDPTVPATRLVPITDATGLTEEQQELWDTVAGSARAGTAVRPEGQLTGPFDVLLRSPGVGVAVSQLGERLRFETTLGPRITEVVVLAVAGHWHAEYAWLRHAIYAEREGIPAEAVAAVAADEPPELVDPRDELAFAIAHGLVTTGQVEETTYRRAVEVFGERALVELVSLAGYYCLSSFLLNTFQVPLPEGATVPWHDRGRS